MKHPFQVIFFLMALCTACQSEHNKQAQVLNRLMESCEQYDSPLNESDARSTLFYMERHGSPIERQKAWRMMAKVYHCQGKLFYEGFAYEMALDCVDSTNIDYDSHTVAEILFEASVNQYYNLDDLYAHILARKAMNLSLASGDSLSYFRYMGQDSYFSLMAHHSSQYLEASQKAFEELWKRGRKDWAVDALFPYMVYMNDGHQNDSVASWMRRYEQNTKQDLLNPESFAAIDYWKLKGDYFVHVGNYDSAHYYYGKLELPQNNYALSQYYHGMLALYDQFREHDPDGRLRKKYDEQLAHHITDMKRDRLLECKVEHNERNNLIERELKYQQQRAILFGGLLSLTFICIFAIHRYRLLRQRHKDILLQNYEYAELIKNAKYQDKPNILDTEIANRFHELSAQDTHPRAEEWQALQDEINKLHPQLLTTLQQQYAMHQPDQTMTEQERHVVCLLVIKCSPLQMSVLLVCTKSNVSNLRRRLYNKLTGKDGSGTDLDRYITKMCEE